MRSRHRLAYFVAIALALAPALGSWAWADKSSDVAAQYSKHNYRIAMRDGVHLFTAVYAPRDTTKRYPILLTRSPYPLRPYGDTAYPDALGPSPEFAREGYIFVYQNVRGRIMSEGQFVEMRPEDAASQGSRAIDESTDAYDTIDWLIHNIPGNNGKVGVIGTSYPGFYASAALIHAHPALAAVSPQAPIADLYMGDDAYHNGAFMLAANFGFYAFFTKQDHPVLPGPDRSFHYGTDDGYKYFLQLGPIVNSEARLRPNNPYWDDIVAHTNYDRFWQSRNILPHLTNIHPAVLVVGGWYDAEDLSGTLKTFRAIHDQSPETDLHLVMGPWVHGGWNSTRGTDRLGDISFGPNPTEPFRTNMQFAFFEHYLKDAPPPDLPAASVFETGANAWRRESAWPPAAAHAVRFYLEAGHALATGVPADGSAFDEYISDPAAPVPSFAKPTTDVPRTYMDADQRFVEERSDVLTYATPPLDQDLTIAGPISPVLSLSTSGTDSDFIVKLIDVYPPDAPGPLAGYEQLVRGEPFRGKFRNSFEHPEPFQPGAITQIHYAMPDVYHSFRKGHRILVQVQSSWFPLIDRNPQTFTEIPTAPPAQFVKATERVYHSSYIELNVVP